MSQIDVYRHELCGQLAGLPVYRVLDHVPDGEYHRPVTPTTLLIGGGSGEHGAAVIDAHQAASSMVLEAFDAWYQPERGHAAADALDWMRHHLVQAGALTDEQAGTYDDEMLSDLLTDLCEALLPTAQLTRHAGEFAGWSGAEWIAVGKHLEQVRPWRPGADPLAAPENYLRDCIGEYVLVSYPELVVDRAVNAGKAALFAAVRTMLAEWPVMLGVMAYPSGYEHVGGRRNRLGDGNVRH